jgi:uncharacterized protein (DUF1800 family)
MLKPLARGKWDFAAAAHLLNRAGFGGTPKEIEALHSRGLEKAVAHLVDYEGITDETSDPSWAQPDTDRARRFMEANQATPEERRKLIQAEQRSQIQKMIELRGWWLKRMAEGPRPLQEKMTLFWHGHFATSFQKVRDAYLMWLQNDLFRTHATGNWEKMLVAVGKDPAMLIWLDQAQSRKEHPNENFAREVMELFALGEGHYKEKDITEAARALTGWSYDRRDQQFVNRFSWHDGGEKTIFGKTGNFDGDEFIGLIVAQPQAARFITAKLWNYFSGSPASEELTGALAEKFRSSGNEFKQVLKTMFLSEEFYSPTVIRNQVKSPVQWLVGSVKVLERELPPPFVSTGLTRNLGQDLFVPPNVKGWDGGVSWITTNNLLARYNEAEALVQGNLAAAGQMFPNARPAGQGPLQRRMQNARIGTVDPTRLLTEEERKDRDALVAALEKRLIQGKLKPKQEQTLRDYLDSETEMNDRTLRNAIRLVMSTPEYQLT